VRVKDVERVVWKTKKKKTTTTEEEEEEANIQK
jgi:hypothetical protein